MILNCPTIADLFHISDLVNNESIIIDDKGFIEIVILPIDSWLYARAALFLATDKASVALTNIRNIWGRKKPNWSVKYIHINRDSIIIGTNRKLNKRERDKWSGEIIDLGMIPEDIFIEFEVMK